MSKLRITLPPMAEGQTGWQAFAVLPQYETPPDERKWHTKAIYRVLMWMHDHAESFWHWCYRVSRKYDRPKAVPIESKYYPLEIKDSITREEIDEMFED
jgi:hypothetical protein